MYLTQSGPLALDKRSCTGVTLFYIEHLLGVDCREPEVQQVGGINLTFRPLRGFSLTRRRLLRTMSWCGLGLSTLNIEILST